MFYFEQMFNTALNGIVSAGLMSTVLTVAYGILLASLLFAAYETWARGGDVRALGAAAVKYLALGLLFLNGGAVYDSVFRAVLQAFNQVAHAMAGAGPGDVFRSWGTELWNAASSPTWLNFVTGVVSAVLSGLLLVVAMLFYPVAYMLFAVLYSLYGSILYVAGPLVLALMPSLSLGLLARRYAVNFMIFASWGLIYGVFCRLVIALNINSMAAITGAGSFAGALAGASQEVLLAAASILFSICIFLIPFLAKRIVEGDVGATMSSVLGTTAGAIQGGVAALAGLSGGFAAVPSSVAEGGGGGAAAAGSNAAPPTPAPAVGGNNTAGTTASSQAPQGPGGPVGGSHPGDWRPVNVPHAIGWLAGAAAATAANTAERGTQAVRGWFRKTN